MAQVHKKERSRWLVIRRSSSKPKRDEAVARLPDVGWGGGSGAGRVPAQVRAAGAADHLAACQRGATKSRRVAAGDVYSEGGWRGRLCTWAISRWCGARREVGGDS